MSNILVIAFATEGTTDRRFLQEIIKKTFIEIAYECPGLIEIHEPEWIPFNKPKSSFINDMKSIAVEAINKGAHVLCIHVDADSVDDKNVFEYKIKPAVEAVKNANGMCKNIVAIVPVRMSEAWMLADKDLLKDLMNTNLSDQELGIDKSPEIYADPKVVIENALRKAQVHLPKRRKRILINELYQPIAQQISMQQLNKLTSFLKFKEEVKQSFIKLNYIS